MGKIWKTHSSQRDDEIRHLICSAQGGGINRCVSDISSAAARIIQSRDNDAIMLVGTRMIEVGNELVKEALVRELSPLETAALKTAGKE